jgi:hypothetical protein
MRKLLKKYGFVPERITTDKLASYAAAVRELGIESRHQIGGRTIAPRIHISRPVEGSARCSDLRASDRLRDFSRHTPLSTTPSTSNAISHHGILTKSFAPKR